MYTNFVEYATPQSLYLRAYMDVNENSHLDAWEPQWIGETVSAIVGSSWNLDIVLSDVPSVWGTITYSNAVGQTLRVLATLSNNWNAVAITDVEGTTNGVSEYLLMGVPPGEPVWIRAFVDANTNGLYSPGESAGYYPATLAVSNRVTEANIVLDQDTDLDGLPDWWEHMYFGGPTNAVASVDTDNDGLTAAEEFALGTHPENPDTDGDGLEDGAEVNTHGTNPLNPDTDGDGVSDDQEIMDGTDPNDAEDFWASLSGTIVYTGDQTGPIYVDVYRDGTNFVERITVGTNGLFTTTNLHGRASVTLRAFLDDNANGVMDEAAEAFGAFVMPFFIHIGEIIRLELEHEDRDGDGIPNYRDANPTQFDDRDGDRVGDGYDPEPDDPNTWVTLSVTQPLPSGAGVFSMDPQLPTNAVISKVEMYYTINAGPTGTINGKNLAEIVIPEPGGCMGEDEFGECIPGSSNGDIGYDLTPAFPNRKIGTCMIVVSEPDDLSEATITWTYKVIIKVEFVDNQSDPLDPVNAHLRISNFPTNERLGLADGADDPDNFRVRITPNISGVSNPKVWIQSNCANDSILDFLEVTLTATNGAYYSDYLRLVIAQDATNAPAQTLKAELLGNLQIVSNSLFNGIGHSISTGDTNYIKVVNLNITIFSQDGIFLFGGSGIEATSIVQDMLAEANAIYASVGVLFRANIATHNLPAGGGLSLSNGLPCGIFTPGIPNYWTDVSGQRVIPTELQAFKEYVMNPTNSILSPSANDIEVLYALPPGIGFSSIRSTDGAEIENSGLKGIAFTPDYPSTLNVDPWAGVGTHTVILMPDTAGAELLLRTLLPHEILHVLTREEHTAGGADDWAVEKENHFMLGRRVTTAPYLSSFGYSVSSSYENQEEKVRSSSLIKNWSVP